jgi:hypothetical protein
MSRNPIHEPPPPTWFALLLVVVVIAVIGFLAGVFGIR